MRRFAAASAILATLLVFPVAQVAATSAITTPPSHAANAAPTDTDRATSALEYMLAAQGSDGSLDGSIGETADFVIGAADAGYDPSTLTGCSGTTSALDYIATASDSATTNAGGTAKAILAVVGAGLDPTNFQGRNLISRLTALYDSGAGLYGAGDNWSQSLAILALLSSGQSVPSAAADYLTTVQDADGSWEYTGGPGNAGDGDSNSTALVLEALHAAGITSADSATFTYLTSQQVASGGFAFSTAYGSSSDPDSDSYVIQGLVAAGENPTDSAWSQGSNNALTDLRSMQATDGGFVDPTYGESVFTTSEVPAGLMRMPYGAVTHFAAGAAVPTTSCPAAPAPTPTPTPTPTASGAAPTPTPTPALTLPPTATGSDGSSGSGMPAFFVFGLGTVAALACVLGYGRYRGFGSSRR